MKTITFSFLLISVLTMSTSFQCKNSTSSEEEEDPLIYYNSFETNSDVEEWTNWWEMMLVEDTAPNCGKRSLRLVRANSSITFKPMEKNQYIQIEFYGKKIGGRAEVMLCLGDPEKITCLVSIIDKSWTVYQNEQKFFWPADSSLTISLKNLGLVPSVMCVDELKIIRKN
jgi:hypothetical protein